MSRLSTSLASSAVGASIPPGMSRRRLSAKPHTRTVAADEKEVLVTPEDKVLKAFLDRQPEGHIHIRPPQVRALYSATAQVGSENILAVQKVVLSCEICSAVLAESSPTYAGSAHVSGVRSA